MNDPTFVAKTYTDSMLGDFEEFVDKNLEPHVNSVDPDERVRLAILGMVSATGGLAAVSLHPNSDDTTELMAIHMGDVLYCLAAVCNAYGVPLDAVMDTAIEEHIHGDDR